MGTNTKRDFLKFGALCAAAFSGTGLLTRNKVFAQELKLEEGGKDYSPVTGTKRDVIPSACWQCVARDTNLCYIENGRLVKIEGNPKSIRNRGKLCSKGQAGVNQLYDPDRILYPMVRAGARGEGKWQRISWEEALNLLVNGGDIAGDTVKGLKTLLREGKPENFMFHYGRLKGSDSKMVKDFLTAYGTGTIGNHTSICEGGKWTGQELTWGKHYDLNDTEHTNMILNFGCNFFETHTSHIQLYQRAMNAISDRGVKLYTFDVRLSNTAAKSTEWIPIKPGTDLAVVLALCNVIMSNNLYDKEFLETWCVVDIQELTRHLSQYTAEWAEKISGVPAAKISSLATAYANAKPGTCVSYRGAVAHHNGTETERAMKMLDAICGYIDVKGGTCHAVSAKWSYPKSKPAKKINKLKIADGFPGDIAYPTHHANHQILKVIKDGSHGRPDIYMMHCYQPVYVNGECQENIDILKDTSIIPFLVAVSPFYGESEALSDLILPDVTYLERLSWDDMVCYDMIPEFYLRQPVVNPIGESRQFQDVIVDIAKRLHIPLVWESAEDFIKQSCKKSNVDYEYLKKHGVWHDPAAKPKYGGYKKELAAEDYSGDDILFDEKTGVYWNWTKSKAKNKEEAVSVGYTKTKDAYKGYVGQKIGVKVHAGFKPDKVNKSGKFEIYSELLNMKKLNPLPTWFAVPSYKNIKDNECILVSYKVMAQTHSRTQNCKWLTELYHQNPALLNTKTAQKLGVKDGDLIKVTSPVSEIVTKVKLTETIMPDLLGISNHCGHWEYGRYASGKKAPLGRDDDPGLKLKSWGTVGDDPKKWVDNGVGVHCNWLIPNKPDPIGGQWAMNDTVVKIAKA